MRRGGFTVVELLCVLGILVVLVALLFPALASSREAGGRTVCVSNLKQLHVAITLYRHEHDGDGRYGESYTMGLPPTFQQDVAIPATQTLRCPAVPNELITSTMAVTYKYYFRDPDKHDDLVPTWARYAQEYREDAVLYYDLSHNPKDAPLEAPLVWKFGRAVTLGGSLMKKRKQGEPHLKKLWWHF